MFVVTHEIPSSVITMFDMNVLPMILLKIISSFQEPNINKTNAIVTGCNCLKKGGENYSIEKYFGETPVHKIRSNI